MAREHRKERSYHRSPKQFDSHRSHKSHKSHKLHRPHRVHTSKRDVSESPSSSQSKEDFVGLSTSSPQSIFTAFARDGRKSQKKHATKIRRVNYPPEPEPAEIRNAQSPPPPPKARKTVSIAGVFKRQNYQPPERKQRKVKQKIPDPPLAIKIQTELEGAYATLRAASKSSFGSIHAQFRERIQEIREKDKEMIQFVSKAAERLNAPLVEEDVRIEVVRQGKRVQETVTIGSRVIAFKAFIKKESANLKELWEQWDEVQDEYMDLGLEVLGVEGFGDNLDPEIHLDRGYKKDKEEHDLQHSIAVEGLNEDIGELKPTITKRMKVLEKELDIEAKKDQEAFLRTLLFV